jgi:hypothetical protein
MASLSVAPQSSVQRLEKRQCTHANFLQLLLALVQLPLLAGARVRSLEVPDEDSAQVGPVVDLVAWQVLEPRPRRVAEVERQVLDDEEIIRRCPPCDTRAGSPRATRWCCVPVVPRYVGRSSKTRGEPRTPDALAKGSWTPLIWRPVAVTIIVVVMALLASSVVVVAQAVVMMVVNAPGLSAGPDGVPRIMMRPEPALDYRRRDPAPFCMVLMLRGRWVRVVCGWCSCSTTLQPLP